MDKPAEKPPASKPPSTKPLPESTPTTPPTPGFGKVPPSELYRRLLPAALFLLTFVTVMTILLMYMDTTALRAQQFRVNMTRDYDLRIPQDDPSFVAYVRQYLLAPGTKPVAEGAEARPTQRVETLLEAVNNERNGTFVEVLVGGGRDPGTLWLERQRGWRGLVVRANPRDHLGLRAAASVATHSLHACLSTVSHPKEVTYYESAGGWRHDGVSVDALDGGFSSRVLCLPLQTILVAGAQHCRYLVVSAPGVLSALRTLPATTNIQVIEVRMPADPVRTNTTEFLRGRGYEIRAEYADGILYEKTTDIIAKV